jgi:hypothetical protein
MKIKPAFLLFLPVVIFAFYAIFFVKKREVDSAAGMRREAELLQRWQTNSFVGVEDMVSIRESVDNSIKDAAPRDVKKALSDHIISWISAYSRHSWPEYSSFRYPLPLPSTNTMSVTFDEELYPVIQESVLAYGYTNSLGDSLSVISNYYEKVLPALKQGSGENVYCLGCWNGIALSEIRVGISEDPKTLNISGAPFDDKYESATRPSSVAEYRPPSLDQKKREKIFASCKLMVRISSGGNMIAYPVYLSSFWDADAKVWVPYDLVVGVGNQYCSNYLF